MFAGPVFTREVVTAPRRTRLYIARAAYVAALLVLLSTAWQVLAGTQVVRNVGDLARFGAMVFQILAPLQLGVVMFFAALSAASAVAAEKDRQTLVLLLLTNLSNVELVLGKLLASLLNVLVLIVASVPLFMLLALLGGVSFSQIARALAITLAGVIAAGSLGSTLALWREKTFQTLAMTALALVFWLGLGEFLSWGADARGWLGISGRTWASAISPWQAVLEATRPYPDDAAAFSSIGGTASGFLLSAAALTVALNAVAVLRVRAWNPPQETRRGRADSSARESFWRNETQEPDNLQGRAAETGSPQAAQMPLPGSVAAGTATTPAESAPRPSEKMPPTRVVWDNPILWREMRTWAYGRRILIVRLAYLALFALAGGGLFALVQQPSGISRGEAALVLVPFFILSLVLLNAQAVTALTSERDARALDLLLVTDLTPKEFIYGKLGGVFYNTKEMVVLPMLLCLLLWYSRALSLENLLYLLAAWLVMCCFVAMLGIHTGMTYVNSHSAIAVSLGTVFFLFVGVAVCMRIMVAFSGSFQVQLTPFLAFIIGGGAGLYAALGWRNPSSAIQMASIVCPFAIFYAITSFLLGYTLGVFLVLSATFGFTTAAMLVPAIFEFDVATGRTTAGDE